MKAEAFNVYTEFFTHTQNICFFLQAQAWQERSDVTIERLADNSAFVAQQIEDSSKLQTEIMEQQKDSIKNQEVLLERGMDLRSTLEQSKTDVQLMLQELKTTTHEQRSLIFEVFDRVNSLQSLVMGEFTGFYSFIFYAVSILVIYLLTSTPRTSGARFWLFLVMTLNMVVEKILSMWGASDEFDLFTGHTVDENTVVFGRLRWCRKVFTTVAVLVWVWVAYRYQDLNRINNQLLNDIKRQNLELKILLQSTGIAAPRALDDSSTIDLPDAAKSLVAVPVVDISHDSTGYESESSSSSSSGETDRTYTQHSDDDVSESDSFETTSSGRSTPVNILDELRDATPMREFTLIRNANDFSPFKGRSSSPFKGRSSSPFKLPGSPTTAARNWSPNECPYNLRSRRPVQSNPIVDAESPETFGKHVKHLARLAVKNRTKAIATVDRLSNPRASATREVNFFSSDEEF